MNDVEHPLVPGWIGLPSWTEPGQAPQTMVVFEASDHDVPFRIDHGRDMIYDGGALQQDYNFIDYYFGDPESPAMARYYLDGHGPDLTVSLRGHGNPRTEEEAQHLLPSGMLAYLQKRFNRIAFGDVEIWSAGS